MTMSNFQGELEYMLRRLVSQPAEENIYKTKQDIIYLIYNKIIGSNDNKRLCTECSYESNCPLATSRNLMREEMRERLLDND